MSYRKILHENYYILCWVAPEKGDPARVVEEVARLHKMRNKKPIYIAVAPDSTKPPDPQTRTEMGTVLQDLADHCESIHLVFEGEGFRRAVKQSALVGVLMAAPANSGQLKVHATMDEVFGALKTTSDHRGLRVAAREIGIMVTG